MKCEGLGCRGNPNPKSVLLAVTEYVLCRLQHRDVLLNNVLPLETLKDVKELSITFDCFNYAQPEWPTAYCDLTSLTRLSYALVAVSAYPHSTGAYSHLPLFLADMKHLRDVQMAVGFQYLLRSGEADVAVLAYCLPLLFRLQIDIDGLQEAASSSLMWRLHCGISKLSRGYLGWAVAEWLERICVTVCKRVPMMGYAVQEPAAEDAFVDWRLIFTLEK